MQNKFSKFTFLILLNCLNINAESALTITSPQNGLTILNNRPTIKGIAIVKQSGGPISVNIDGVFIGIASQQFCPPPQQCVNWNITPKKPLKVGVHTVLARAILDGRLVTATSTFTVVSEQIRPNVNTCNPCCR